MPMAIALILALVAVFPVSNLRAQQPAAVAVQAVDAPTGRLQVGTTEWMVSAGPAWGVELFHSTAGHRYLLPSISWGRVLTRPLGPGALRGRFEWAFEAVPIYAQTAPQRTYGFGFTPLVWRWNFDARGAVIPFAELAGGALWTRDPVPANTTTANFTAHVGFGLRFFVQRRLGLVTAYRFHHISNGNRLEQNPGVNAHMLQLGLSVLGGR